MENNYEYFTTETTKTKDLVCNDADAFVSECACVCVFLQNERAKDEALGCFEMAAVIASFVLLTHTRFCMFCLIYLLWNENCGRSSTISPCVPFHVVLL